MPEVEGGEEGDGVGGVDAGGAGDEEAGEAEELEEDEEGEEATPGFGIREGGELSVGPKPPGDVEDGEGGDDEPEAHESGFLVWSDSVGAVWGGLYTAADEASLAEIQCRTSNVQRSTSNGEGRRIRDGGAYRWDHDHWRVRAAGAEAGD